MQQYYNNSLAGNFIFRNFALRNELNYYRCSVQIFPKTRRGYCIADLVRFATSQIPAALFFLTSSKKSRIMNSKQQPLNRATQSAYIAELHTYIAELKATIQLLQDDNSWLKELAIQRFEKIYEATEPISNVISFIPIYSRKIGTV